MYKAKYYRYPWQGKDVINRRQSASSTISTIENADDVRERKKTPGLDS